VTAEEGCTVACVSRKTQGPIAFLMGRTEKTQIKDGLVVKPCMWQEVHIGAVKKGQWSWQPLVNQMIVQIHL